jgi:uracil-DNA glycosylase
MLLSALSRRSKSNQKMNITEQAKKQLSPLWLKNLRGELDKDYWLALKQYLAAQAQLGKVIYPPAEKAFSAFSQTDLNIIQVVIIGQDPYHGPNQANGLCFSVNPGNKIPPSLKNIFSELSTDQNAVVPNHGSLDEWAKQGVFLLNTVLSVEQACPGIHADKGWERFTDTVIRVISDERESVVFMLWGNYAGRKKSLIDESKHLILEAAHPSPLSAYRGFFGCKHFSLANDYLVSKKSSSIDWQIPMMSQDTQQISLEL